MLGVIIKRHVDRGSTYAFRFSANKSKADPTNIGQGTVTGTVLVENSRYRDYKIRPMTADTDQPAFIDIRYHKFYNADGTILTDSAADTLLAATRGMAGSNYTVLH